jgi:hypothetical protein
MITTHYSEVTFAIDIISDAYNTTDPVEIVAKSKEILSIDMTVSQVMDYLCHTEDFEYSSRSITIKSLFNEERVV